MARRRRRRSSDGGLIILVAAGFVVGLLIPVFGWVFDHPAVELWDRSRLAFELARVRRQGTAQA